MTVAEAADGEGCLARGFSHRHVSHPHSCTQQNTTEKTQLHPLTQPPLNALLRASGHSRYTSWVCLRFPQVTAGAFQGRQDGDPSPPQDKSPGVHLRATLQMPELQPPNPPNAPSPHLGQMPASPLSQASPEVHGPCFLQSQGFKSPPSSVLRIRA